MVSRSFRLGLETAFPLGEKALERGNFLAVGVEAINESRVKEFF